MPERNLEQQLEEIRDSVLRGRIRDTERLILEAVGNGADAEQIVRNGLVPAMRNVGDDFKNDAADIPKLLCAARAMQKGMETIQPYLESAGRVQIGKAIIGTVEGDLHEVGKNLVTIMFRGVGFEVVDLGVDVSERQFLKAISDHPDANIICLSSLLTTSIGEMRNVVRKIRQTDREHRLWIMVGGGSITESLAKEMGADAYTENAVDAAEAARAHILQSSEA